MLTRRRLFRDLLIVAAGVTGLARTRVELVEDEPEDEVFAEGKEPEWGCLGVALEDARRDEMCRMVLNSPRVVWLGGEHRGYFGVIGRMELGGLAGTAIRAGDPVVALPDGRIGSYFAGRRT